MSSRSRRPKPSPSPSPSPSSSSSRSLSRRGSIHSLVGGFCESLHGLRRGSLPRRRAPYARRDTHRDLRLNPSLQLIRPHKTQTSSRRPLGEHVGNRSGRNQMRSRSRSRSHSHSRGHSPSPSPSPSRSPNRRHSCCAPPLQRHRRQGGNRGPPRWIPCREIRKPARSQAPTALGDAEGVGGRRSLAWPPAPRFPGRSANPILPRGRSCWRRAERMCTRLTFVITSSDDECSLGRWSIGSTRRPRRATGLAVLRASSC